MVLISKGTSITSIKNKADQEDFKDSWTFLKFQVLQKAGGRILRIGEMYVCWMYIVTVNHACDVFIQVLADQKMIPILTEKATSPPSKEENNVDDKIG